MPGSRARPNACALDVADHPAVIDFCQAQRGRSGRGRPGDAAGGRHRRRSREAPASRRSGRASRRRNSRAQGVHQGALHRVQHSDRGLRPLHDGATTRWPMCARRARRSWSRPMAWPPARASSSPRTLAGGRGGRRHDVRRRVRCGRHRSRDRGILAGREISFFALCDGETALPLATAQDHKRVFDHDEGPNTGGMGAYSPTPFVTPEMHDADHGARSSSRRVAGMKKRGTPFQRRALCRRDADGAGAQAVRIQRAVRRSRMPGADAADDVRHRAGVAGGLLTAN